MYIFARFNVLDQFILICKTQTFVPVMTMYMPVYFSCVPTPVSASDRHILMEKVRKRKRKKGAVKKMM